MDTVRQRYLLEGEWIRVHISDLPLKEPVFRSGMGIKESAKIHTKFTGCKQDGEDQ